MQIKKTQNYKMFKFKKGNREITRGHTKRLVESISKNNMLSANPIIVNEEMYVIDGQHRLEAAKFLKTSIYYVTFNPASLTEIQMLNANQRAWGAMDYANSFIEMGLKDYQIYKDFREKYRLPHGTILSLLMGQTESGQLTKLFKSGQMKVTNLENAIEIADELYEAKDYMIVRTYGSSRFYQALFRMMQKGEIKLFDFLGRLKTSGIKIFPSDNRIGYLRQFEDVLNKGRVGTKRIKLV